MLRLLLARILCCQRKRVKSFEMTFAGLVLRLFKFNYSMTDSSKQSWQYELHPHFPNSGA